MPHSVEDVDNIDLPSGCGIAEEISRGHFIPDLEFDRFFPKNSRSLSEIHWTPVSVAIRAARLAVRKETDRVLDVGSGVGKFCIVGGLATQGQFFGIEQREYLVEYARHVVDRFKIPRVQFLFGNMADLDWRPFDAIYLFNPFSENLDENIRIDDLCELSTSLYYSYVRCVQEKLVDLRVGTRVVTYNGFGGDFPPSYRKVLFEEINFISLQVWEKS